MKKIIVIVFLLSQVVVKAQDAKFGKVSQEALEEKFYELDSTAEAAYLMKKRWSYFDYMPSEGSFQLYTEYHLRIKIYTKEGFDYATKLITYYTPDSGENESVSSIKGYTFFLEENNVMKEKLSKKSIFKEKVNDNFSQVKITMPKIKEGCILDLKYTVTSPYAFYIDDVQFQLGIPIKYLETKIDIPEFYKYNKKRKGYYILPVVNNSKPSKIGDTDYTTETFTYKGNNIPALKDDEAFVYNVDNYRGGIKFELAQTDFLQFQGGVKNYNTSWSAVAKQIYDVSSFGGELRKSAYYKDEIEALLATRNNDYEKIAAIFQYVKKNIRWNKSYNKYAQNGVKKAFKEKTGNVADINLMLTSMLRFAGLDANPVLVSSRGNGIPLFPTSRGFDYVISSVTFSDGKYLLLDATEFYSMPNLLPTRASNWKGRLVKKGGASKWVSLQSSKSATEDTTMMIKFDEDLIAQGRIRTKYDNLNALRYRRSSNHVKEESLIANYEDKNNIEVEEFSVDNKLNISKPIVRNVKFESEDLVEGIGNKLYIEPLLFFTERENPFKLDERKFPIEFDAKSKEAYNVLIDIPEGYQIEKLPEPLAIGMPNNMGIFKYQVRKMGNRIKTSCVLEFKTPTIAPQYYPYLKEFYNQIVKKESEKIVLSKI
ncbi:transglutaminase domain-containing protein [uncultured Polaribacter sp.]|uniref:transglutaminase domain-containing protein n=1 Tax=uncultured Polaribacter sp. TaxID=174711 RepID=UPI002617A7C3|nr:transglutaminase domain-containing protein [uncultured Polaribacter sp.]